MSLGPAADRPASLTAVPVTGLPEVRPGTDLAARIVDHAALADGDVVALTSKVVSKAEGRVRRATREAAIAEETVRTVAARDDTVIVRTRHGLTLAAAGVDGSNTERGTVVLLPEDPDASARRIRAGLQVRTGRTVAVVVTDTAGRPWRSGQTDIAVGVAGLPPLVDYTGRSDRFGNPLAVTAPAVADEVAALADLVMGKLAGVPVAVVRGLAGMVTTEDGPGAVALVRADADDMFGLGSLEAVRAAVCRDDAAALAALRRDHSDVEDLVALATRSGGTLTARRTASGDWEVDGPDDLGTAAALERLLVLAATSPWRAVTDERNHGRCRVVLSSG